eukprot:scpid83977/ scgid32207/ 
MHFVLSLPVSCHHCKKKKKKKSSKHSFLRCSQQIVCVFDILTLSSLLAPLCDTCACWDCYTELSKLCCQAATMHPYAFSITNHILCNKNIACLDILLLWQLCSAVTMVVCRAHTTRGLNCSVGESANLPELHVHVCAADTPELMVATIHMHMLYNLQYVYMNSEGQAADFPIAGTTST